MDNKFESYQVADINIFIYRVRYNEGIVEWRGAPRPDHLYEFYFGSIEELIKHVCKSSESRASDARIDSTPVHYRSSVIVRSLRNRDSYIASEEEIDSWKRGEFDLYIHELSFDVSKVMCVEASELKELGMKEETTSNQEWLKRL